MTLNPEQFGGYSNIVEHVPVHALDRIKEYDREKEWPDVREHIGRLAEDIRQNGVKEPLLVIYGQKDRQAYLGEGNHRLAAAKRLGLSSLPVRVLRESRIWREGAGHPVPGHDPELERHGYIPADLKPSQIGLPVEERD